MCSKTLAWYRSPQWQCRLECIQCDLRGDSCQRHVLMRGELLPDTAPLGGELLPETAPSWGGNSCQRPRPREEGTPARDRTLMRGKLLPETAHSWEGNSCQRPHPREGNSCQRPCPREGETPARDRALVRGELLPETAPSWGGTPARDRALVGGTPVRDHPLVRGWTPARDRTLVRGTPARDHALVRGWTPARDRALVRGELLPETARSWGGTPARDRALLRGNSCQRPCPLEGELLPETVPSWGGELLSCFKLLYMQTLKYMLKIILLPDYYTINYLLNLCYNYFFFYIKVAPTLATCICLNGSLLDQLSCTIVYLHNLFTCTFGRINMSVCLSVRDRALVRGLTPARDRALARGELLPETAPSWGGNSCQRPCPREGVDSCQRPCPHEGVNSSQRPCPREGGTPARDCVLMRRVISFQWPFPLEGELLPKTVLSWGGWTPARYRASWGGNSCQRSCPREGGTPARGRTLLRGWTPARDRALVRGDSCQRPRPREGELLSETVPSWGGNSCQRPRSCEGVWTPARDRALRISKWTFLSTIDCRMKFKLTSTISPWKNICKQWTNEAAGEDGRVAWGERFLPSLWGSLLRGHWSRLCTCVSSPRCHRHTGVSLANQ